MQESLKMTWRIQHWSLATQRLLLLLQNLLIPSKNPHNSLSNRCCLLPFRVNVLKHFNVCFTESKPLSQLWKKFWPSPEAQAQAQVQSPQLLRGHSTFEFQDYRHWAPDHGSTASLKIFSASFFRVWLNTMGLGQTTKVRKDIIRDEINYGMISFSIYYSLSCNYSTL